MNERKRALEKMWKIVEQARSQTVGIPVKVIQREVDKAVREVRARKNRRPN